MNSLKRLVATEMTNTYNIDSNVLNFFFFIYFLKKFHIRSLTYHHMDEKNMHLSICITVAIRMHLIHSVLIF